MKNKENNKKIKRMQAIFTRKDPYIGQQTDSKWLTNVLLHKRSRGQIYIHLLSEHWSTVCCPLAVRSLSKILCCVDEENLKLVLPDSDFTDKGKIFTLTPFS